MTTTLRYVCIQCDINLRICLGNSYAVDKTEKLLKSGYRMVSVLYSRAHGLLGGFDCIRHALLKDVCLCPIYGTWL